MLHVPYCKISIFYWDYEAFIFKYNFATFFQKHSYWEIMCIHIRHMQHIMQDDHTNLISYLCLNIDGSNPDLSNLRMTS